VKLLVKKTEKLLGDIAIPASKSHTIRAVFIASLAGGESLLRRPLFSEDTRAAVNACRMLGAQIEQSGADLKIRGFGAQPKKPGGVVDMLNSGTSTNLMIGALAGLDIEAVITGDASLRSRPVAALADALIKAGCTITWLDRQGCPPLRISGSITGSAIELDAAKSSQYTSSLLLACPLLPRDTEIRVKNPSELPYIEMTLKWLDEQGIRYERSGFSWFKIFGNQRYRPFEKIIPADWSSATFPVCAAALADGDVFVRGVDMHDVQGDKAVIDYLKSMGASAAVEAQGIRIRGCRLTGATLDINATPDALPALSVVGCCAHGATKLHNVAQARVKETDRITVMAQELQKMNARIEELPDGLLIHHSALKGASVQGHHDHRVVMALALAGLVAEGETVIDTAEAISVTYPDFVETMHMLGANITLL